MRTPRPNSVLLTTILLGGLTITAFTGIPHLPPSIDCNGHCTGIAPQLQQAVELAVITTVGAVVVAIVVAKLLAEQP